MFLKQKINPSERRFQHKTYFSVSFDDRKVATDDFNLKVEQNNLSAKSDLKI